MTGCWSKHAAARVMIGTRKFNHISQCYVNFTGFQSGSKSPSSCQWWPSSFCLALAGWCMRCRFDRRRQVAAAVGRRRDIRRAAQSFAGETLRCRWSGDTGQPPRRSADFVAFDRLVREEFKNHMLAASASENCVKLNGRYIKSRIYSFIYSKWLSAQNGNIRNSTSVKIFGNAHVTVKG